MDPLLPAANVKQEVFDEYQDEDEEQQVDEQVFSEVIAMVKQEGGENDSEVEAEVDDEASVDDEEFGAGEGRNDEEEVDSDPDWRRDDEDAPRRERRPRKTRTTRGRRAGGGSKGAKRESQKKYSEKNREEINRKQREYYQKNKDRILKDKRQTYGKKESGFDEAQKQERARLKRYQNYQANREEKLKKQREYYRRKKEEMDYEEFRQKRRQIYLKTKERQGGKPPKEKKGKATKNRSEKDIDEEMKVGTEGVMDPNDDPNVPLQPCFELVNAEQYTKFDPTKKGEDGCGGEAVTFPQGYALTGRFVSYAELGYVDCFVAMTLGADGDSVEVRHLLHKNSINAKGLQLLLHAVMAVVDMELKELFCLDRSSPVSVVNFRNQDKLRNEYCKELLAKPQLEKPEEPKPVCLPTKSRETLFISDEIARVPHHQLIPNQDLSACETGAVGVQIVDGDEVLLAPLFAVNMIEWRANVKYLFTVLLTWLGDRERLKDLLYRTPCGALAKEQLLYEVKDECYQVCLAPKQLMICPHCGLSFEINPFLIADTGKYRHHINTHNNKCAVCGEEFPNFALRMYHQRTHNPEHYVCPKAPACKFVGASKKTTDSHVKFQHTSILCDLCGKEYANIQSLNLHMGVAHLNHQFPCPICAKIFTSKGQLSKHVKRHDKPDSSVNQPPKFKEPKASNGAPKRRREKGEAVVCDICGKIFMEKALLDRHKMRHENDPAAGTSNSNQNSGGSSNANTNNSSSSTSHHVAAAARLPEHHKALYYCKRCSKGYPSMQELIIHEQICVPRSRHEDETDDSQDSASFQQQYAYQLPLPPQLQHHYPHI